MPKEKKEKKSKSLESGLEDVQMGDAAASKVGQFEIAVHLVLTVFDRRR